MELLQRFRSYIGAQQLFPAQHTLVLAVSGGVDSMVLAELTRLAGYHTIIAHCNFSLRGVESDADEQLVKVYAGTHGIPFHSKRFDSAGYAASNKLSIQMAARELRYRWFNELLQAAGGASRARILTAHHLDDNTETMLMNFFKGTGIAGLRGIKPLSGAVARPLLFARKTELVEWAGANHIAWRNDHSNEENKYTRNFFRNQLLPLVTTVFPAAEENLAGNQLRFAGIETLYQESLGRHLKRLLLPHGSDFRVPVKLLAASEVKETVAWEIFRGFGFSPAAVSDVLALCKSETGHYVSSATHRVIRHREWLVITGIQPEEGSLVVIDGPGTYKFPGGSLLVEPVPYHGESPDLGADSVLADAAELLFPLVLRPVKAGDYFYPLGMVKKKKLARFMTDLKMPRHEKEKVWVLETGKKICWLPGLRLDNRFRVKPHTKQVFRLTLVNH
ncbi:MAG: tRNA lysidine(34) synthetase TilS [Chitinophagaceae bacterium]|nr:MAG: tRNA lysidine(34) synthetase TilS [Chitinophagaceae bacterium]